MDEKVKKLKNEIARLKTELTPDAKTEALISRLEEIEREWNAELEALQKERDKYTELNKELRSIRNAMLGNTKLQRKIAKTLYKIE